MTSDGAPVTPAAATDTAPVAMPAASSARQLMALVLPAWLVVTGQTGDGRQAG